MARLRLLQPYNLQPVGAVIELPGGIASCLVLRRIAEITTEPVTNGIENSTDTEMAAKTTNPAGLFCSAGVSAAQWPADSESAPAPIPTPETPTQTPPQPAANQADKADNKPSRRGR